MAISASQNGSDIAALLQTAPDKYVSLGDLLKYNKPDNRDLLIQTYGDQGITGFLELTGAVRSAGTADEVQYWEEGRLHKTVAYSSVADSVVTVSDNDPAVVRLNDVLLFPDGTRAIVTDQDTSNTTFTVAAMDGSAAADFDIATAGTAVIIGNAYAQGTDQPTEFYNTDVVKRTNPFLISKESYEVNGSQATNIGWINVGNGDYRWYVKGEMDTRKRFMNQREMMMLLSQKVTDTATAGADNIGSTNIVGSEGYFSAIEDRGIVASGTFEAASGGTALAEFDEIILLLDAQGAPSEYAMYVNRQTSLHIDDMLANGIATATTAGLAGQFGAFNNSPDMAVQLGFKSFTRGGYTFHKHDWKLLNDPTLLGATGHKFKGAMVPMSQVADARTGVKAPALEMNYKEANGYSREMEHWVTAGGVLGFNNDTKDTARFHYRSEYNLITRAANQHVLITS